MTGKREERLIISFDARTPSAFALSEAASGLCEIIWMVDLAVPEMAHFAPLLRKLGSVVDIAGLSVDQAVQDLGSKGPTGVITLNDSRVVLLAEIASKLDLDFHSSAVAERLTDKKLQREAMHTAGLPVPATWAIQDKLDQTGAERIAREVSFPAILKPRRGAGSRNVRQVSDAAELARLIATQDCKQMEHEGWMLEGYLAGTNRSVSRFADVVSAESFISDGVVHHFAVTGRFPFADPFRETGMVLPSDISAADADAVKEVATAAIVALGVRHGCQHTEVKFTPDGPRIIEVNGRLGGAVPQLVTLAGGEVSLFRIAMELALGMPATIDLPLSLPKIAYRRITPPPVWACRIASMAGLDHLKDLPGIADVTFNRQSGDTVDWHLGLGEFVYGVYGSARSYDEVEAICDLIDRTVTITYDEGIP
ncbi:MAG: ATP-grasp domain-containing protein [Acidimicrobiales bacterium]